MQTGENPLWRFEMRLKIAPVLTENLLRLADAYMAAIKPTNRSVSMQSISRNFHGDPPFFDNLRSGKSTCGLTKYDEIVDNFDSRWPPGKRNLFPPLNDPRHGPFRKPPKLKRTTNGKGSKKDRSEKAEGAAQG